MPSKQVIDRQKSASAVLSAGHTHVAPVAGELEKLFLPHLRKGEKLPDIALLGELATRVLAGAAEALVKADATHQDELADDAAPRAGRDATSSALYAELTDLREWARGLYGAAALRRLGFSAETPRDPVALERFAGEVVQALTKGPLPKPVRKGVKWDPDETVQKIESLRATLRQHLADVAREAREAQVTLAAKNEALATYDDRFARVAGFLSGTFRLAGQHALADRVRPSARRPGQTEESAAETEDTDAAASPALPAGG